MRDQDKTKAQLIDELAQMRHQVDELEVLQTERKRTEEMLRENENKFRLLYERVPIPYQSLDEEGRMVEVNQAWLDKLGYSSEEVIGRWFGDFLYPQYVDHFKEMYPLFKAAGEIDDVEFKLVKRDGSQILVSYIGRIAYDEQGNFKQTHCIFRDITERRRAEAALRESEEKYRALIDDMNDGFMIVRGSKVLFANRSAAEAIGRPVEDIIGGAFLQDLASGSMEKSKQIYERTKSGEPLPDYEEFELQRSDGTMTFVGVRLKETVYEGERAYSLLIRDITERRKAEQAIKLEKERLQSLIDGLSTTEIGIDIVGTDYRIVFQNDLLQQRFGDMTGQLCYQAYMALTKPCNVCPMIRAIKNKRVERAEIITVDGRTYELVSAPLPEPDGTINKAIEVFTDITERKEAEDKLKESEERFRTIFDNAPVGLLVADGGSKKIY
ncbi:MAG: PAS domain S-box protein, partial [Desulfobacteraceae bacterium]|nr:PAS domain S-box protein [Desulfobacteraceae bacterium]